MLGLSLYSKYNTWILWFMLMATSTNNPRRLDWGINTVMYTYSRMPMKVLEGLTPWGPLWHSWTSLTSKCSLCTIMEAQTRLKKLDNRVSMYYNGYKQSLPGLGSKRTSHKTSLPSPAVSWQHLLMYAPSSSCQSPPSKPIVKPAWQTNIGIVSRNKQGTISGRHEMLVIDTHIQ